MADHEGDSDAASVVPAKVSTEPFEYKGACSDEVTLKFDDEKELYVSENLLRYASPVFAEMLKGNQDGVIKLKGSDYADMLVFLRTIHPGLEDKVTESSVFTIVELAEAFGVKGLIALCTECFTRMVKTTTEQVLAQGLTGWAGELSKTKAVSTCLAVLIRAARYRYYAIQHNAISTIARVSCNVYMDNASSSGSTSFFGFSTSSYNSSCVAERKTCRQRYQELSSATQMEIISKRLRKIENNTITT